VTFERPWVLALAVLPVLWFWFERRNTSRRLALVLKTSAFVAVILALSEPRLSISETKTAVAVLVDTSASVSDQDLARESEYAAAVDRARGRNWARIIPFARSTREADPAEHRKGWTLKATAGEAGRATDLEAGLREALVSLPEGLVRRVVLLTDGKENKGSIARAAYQAQQLGIPVDTVALNGRSQPGLHLDAISIPSLTFTGERFPIDLEVTSPRPAQGTIEIQADGKLIGRTPVNIAAGNNRVRAHANLTVSGAIDLSVTLAAVDLGEVRFNQALTLRRPRILYISQDPPGTETNLVQTLGASQFDVTQASDFGSLKLSDYQTLVLNNQNLEAVPPGRKEDIERFVKQGGGLLVIGGERNIYPEGKKIEDALDRALPAKVAPPRSPEGTSVVLIVDKSSSMEGRKMELARQAAIGVIDNLRPIDTVGVLIFDNSFQWAVPLRRAEDKTLIKRLVAGITPDGGTQIAPALSEAFRKISVAAGTFKHVVLLTDGISEEGDSLEVSREAAAKKVTISTVGLGQDVNRAYLEKVATLAQGKSYFLNDPSGLEQILLKDVMEHTGSTAVEKQLNAVVARQAEILEGVGMETAPPLKGYVRFQAKPTAETILTIDRTEPLFARWQYGLGRAAVFTSDAKSRWASSWVTWKGFDKFWINVFRDLLPHTQTGEATVDYDGANGELVVDYRLSPGAEEPATVPGIYVFGPAGFQRPVPVAKVAQGAWRGRVPVGQRQGLFRVRPVVESKAFPEIGIYRPEEELTDYGSNPFLLRKLAEYTGGRVNPQPREVFDAGGHSIASTLRLWPGLLALALILNLAELVLRKWPGIFRRSV
jgi:secreted protein with Ig-like and vWFA domain